VKPAITEGNTIQCTYCIYTTPIIEILIMIIYTHLSHSRREGRARTAFLAVRKQLDNK
jgi:hypothetical protein